MKARGAAVQGGLALAALVAAYFAWQRDPTVAAGDVTVLDAPKAAVQAVRFEDATKWVRVEKRGEDVWVTYASQPAPGSAPDAGTPEPVVRELKGNELARRVLDRFAPLTATRALGELPADKKQEVGLTESPRSLEVELRDGKRRFTVSRVAPTGGPPYLEAEGDGRVYIVSPILISDLDAAASRLVDRRLHTFRVTDYDEVVVKAGGAERAFVQTGDAPAALKIAPKATPDRPDEFAKNWLEKVLRLAPLDVLGKGETPAVGEPTVEARVEYVEDGKQVGWTELGTAGTNLLFARTEHTAGWTRVSGGAKELLSDAQKVASGATQ